MKQIIETHFFELNSYDIITKKTNDAYEISKILMIVYDYLRTANINTPKMNNFYKNHKSFTQLFWDEFENIKDEFYTKFGLSQDNIEFKY